MSASYPELAKPLMRDLKSVVRVIGYLCRPPKRALTLTKLVAFSNSFGDANRLSDNALIVAILSLTPSHRRRSAALRAR